MGHDKLNENSSLSRENLLRIFHENTVKPTSVEIGEIAVKTFSLSRK